MNRKERLLGLLPSILTLVAVAIFVWLEILSLPLGVLAAAGLLIPAYFGQKLGDMLFAPMLDGSAKRSRRLIYFLLFAIVTGAWAGIEIANVWGPVGGAFFGIALSAIIGAAGFFETRSAR